jgi:hypothetical protein
MYQGQHASFVQRQNIHVKQSENFSTGTLVIEVERCVPFSTKSELLKVKLAQRIRNDVEQIGSDHTFGGGALAVVRQCKLVPRGVAVCYPHSDVDQTDNVRGTAYDFRVEFSEAMLHRHFFLDSIFE